MIQNPPYIPYTFRVARMFSLLTCLLVGLSCENEEIPDYAKHDWYVHYSVDGRENLIVKDGFDNTQIPALWSYSSYGYNILPDGSEQITFVTIESGFLANDSNSGNEISFNAVFVITDNEIIDSKNQSVEVRIEKLQEFFDGRVFGNISGNRELSNYINIGLTDSEGHAYKNKLFNNGTYGVILDYVIKVKSAKIVEHPNEGEVLSLVLDFEADLEGTDRGGEYTVFARSRQFIVAQFGD